MAIDFNRELWWERRQHTHVENIQRPSRPALPIAPLTRNNKLAMKKLGSETPKGMAEIPRGGRLW